MPNEKTIGYCTAVGRSVCSRWFGCCPDDCDLGPETVQTEEAVALFNKKMEEEGRSVRAEFQLVPMNSRRSCSWLLSQREQHQTSSLWISCCTRTSIPSVRS